MQKMKVIIIGAGGHGKVVADALLKENKYELIGFADDKLPIGTKVFDRYEVIGSTENLIHPAEGFVIAIGNNKIRAEKFEMLKNKMKPVNIVHPFSSIAADVKLGEGTTILAGAIINASVVIGDNCIINSGSLIDHDVVIANHSHIGQAAIIGSGNKLQEQTHIKQNENISSVYY